MHIVVLCKDNNTINITLKTQEKSNIHPCFFSFLLFLRHTLTLQPSYLRICCIAEAGLDFIMEHSLASNSQQSSSPVLPGLRIPDRDAIPCGIFVHLLFLQTNDSYQLLLTQAYQCQFLQSIYSLYLLMILKFS